MKRKILILLICLAAVMSIAEAQSLRDIAADQFAVPPKKLAAMDGGMAAAISLAIADAKRSSHDFVRFQDEYRIVVRRIDQGIIVTLIAGLDTHRRDAHCGNDSCFAVVYRFSQDGRRMISRKVQV